MVGRSIAKLDELTLPKIRRRYAGLTHIALGGNYLDATISPPTSAHSSEQTK